MGASPEEKMRKEQPPRAFGHLKSELDFDFCLECGACVASCPLNSIELEEGPRLSGTCVSCGLCYYQCPQFEKTREIADRIFGGERKSESIGEYDKSYSARASDPEIWERGQDGGAVTALLTSLLEEGFIDGTVVTVSGSNPWEPEPEVAITRDEITEGSGTIYTRGPKLLGVTDAVDLYGLGEIAVVGTPCQIKAFRRMESGGRDLRSLRSKVKILIGLFCSESFSYSGVRKVVEEKLDLDLENVEKIDIEKGDFVAYPEEGSEQGLPVKSLKQYATTPCKVCEDYSAELADVSIGSVGAPSEHSAVLTRTPVGVEAFNRAMEAEAFEVESLEEVKPGLGLLKKLSSKNKEKARKEIERREEEDEPLPPSVK